MILIFSVILGLIGIVVHVGKLQKRPAFYYSYKYTAVWCRKIKLYIEYDTDSRRAERSPQDL